MVIALWDRKCYVDEQPNDVFPARSRRISQNAGALFDHVQIDLEVDFVIDLDPEQARSFDLVTL